MSIEEIYHEMGENSIKTQIYGGTESHYRFKDIIIQNLKMKIN